MNGSGKTACRLTQHGQVVVVDRRHLTDGAIVPNYKVGASLLDGTRWLSEARAEAKHGDWLMFLDGLHDALRQSRSAYST